MLEVTTMYESVSLLHMVLKTEIEQNIASKADINQAIAKLKESSDQLISDLDTVKGGEEFKKDDLKALLQKMKQQRIDRGDLFKKIKTSEASLVAFALLQDHAEGKVSGQDQQIKLADVCVHLVSIMKELQRDQGTVMKKWTTVLSDTESIEIAGQEQKV